METPELDYDRLNAIVEIITTQLSKPDMRALNNRAIQAKIWRIPQVSSYMADLRQQEENLRKDIMKKISNLVFQFQEHSLDVTLARAGILADERVHAGSSLDNATKDGFDLFCLDSKERLYLILKEYDWIKHFFWIYPQHFYENSFQFVDRIPKKKLPVKVKVVGLGIGGSLAVSGLRKSGIESVIGYEKRSRNGPRGVTGRFQNASWRAYDIAERMLDEEAFLHLAEYQQRINVRFDDGTSTVMTADRVQIVLGDAIDTAIASAERYGADLRFDSNTASFCNIDATGESKEADCEAADIVAIFAGAHTGAIVPGLEEVMQMFSWMDLSSACRLWLEIKMSDKKDAYTTRDVEVGAEKWHFQIESARNTKDDLFRIRDNIIAQHNWNLKKLEDADSSEKDREAEMHIAQLAKIEGIMQSVGESKDEEIRFDYIFTNAPDNDHNRAKQDAAVEKGNVVIDGKYQVDIKIASKAVIDSTSSDSGKDLLEQFSTKVIVIGGDACVPPNPMAAYGATLACEFAGMLVQLSVSHGHINAILSGLEKVESGEPDWIGQLEELKVLFNKYYDTRGRSENYFQWMQTLICNLYSLPPIESS